MAKDKKKKALPRSKPTLNADPLVELQKAVVEHRNCKFVSGEPIPTEATSIEIAVAVVRWPGALCHLKAHQRIGSKLSHAVTALRLEHRIREITEGIERVQRGTKLEEMPREISVPVSVALHPPEQPRDARTYSACNDATCDRKCTKCRLGIECFEAVAAVIAERKAKNDLISRLGQILPEHGITTEQAAYFAESLEPKNGVDFVRALQAGRKSPTADLERLETLLEILTDKFNASAIRKAGFDSARLERGVAEQIAGKREAVRRGHRMRATFGVGARGTQKDPRVNFIVEGLAINWEQATGKHPTASYSESNGDENGPGNRNTPFVKFVTAVTNEANPPFTISTAAIARALQSRKHRIKSED